jgi:translation initiation factor IF-2
MAHHQCRLRTGGGGGRASGGDDGARRGGTQAPCPPRLSLADDGAGGRAAGGGCSAASACTRRGSPSPPTSRAPGSRPRTPPIRRTGRATCAARCAGHEGDRGARRERCGRAYGARSRQHARMAGASAPHLGRPAPSAGGIAAPPVRARPRRRLPPGRGGACVDGRGGGGLGGGPRARAAAAGSAPDLSVRAWPLLDRAGDGGSGAGGCNARRRRPAGEEARPGGLAPSPRLDADGARPRAAGRPGAVAGAGGRGRDRRPARRAAGDAGPCGGRRRGGRPLRARG